MVILQLHVRSVIRNPELPEVCIILGLFHAITSTRHFTAGIGENLREDPIDKHVHLHLHVYQHHHHPISSEQKSSETSFEK